MRAAQGGRRDFRRPDLRGRAAVRAARRDLNRPAFRGNGRAAAGAEARRAARGAAAAAARNGNPALAARGNRNRDGIAGRAIAPAAIGASFAAHRSARAGWYRHWRRAHRHAHGWYGPIYWPYAYDTVFADVFYPYADYDYFWDYGYDDIYAGLFSPYDYDDLLTTQAPAVDRRYVRAPPRGTSQTRAAIRQLQPVCGSDSAEVAGVPVAEIQDAIHPTGDQQQALDELGDASVKAAEIVRASCPADIAMTAGGRLENMQRRIEAMIEAVNTVQKPLDRLYGMLDDEQKAKFNAIGARDEARRSASRGPRSLAQSCGVSPVASWPAEAIERAVRPNEKQQDDLADLRKATEDAAARLKEACPTEEPATPTERLGAIARRLDAMLTAVKDVRKPLEKFYASLDDAQKARFNAIGRRASQSEREHAEQR